MTSKELYQKFIDKFIPSENITYTTQFENGKLSGNVCGIYTKLIRDAARCNEYSSDVFYDMKTIEDTLNNFNEEEFEPIWIGFRKMGVDGTSFVLTRVNNQDVYGSLSNNYFALYSINIVNDGDNFYKVILQKYPV